MAIEPTMASVIQQLAPSLPNRKVLCLGYPDILTTDEPPLDEERQSIARWHHWRKGIEHAGHFFGKQNLDAEYWDVTRARGEEKIADLNTMDVSLGVSFKGERIRDVGEFGLICDPGTIEHIANIGNCWRTICAVTAVGGYVVHANPLTMANHGFYSIHPTAYVDMYQANGFEMVSLCELSGPLDNRIMRSVPPTLRYTAEQNAVILCVAKKRESVPFQFPIQSKYRANPTLTRAAQ